MQQFVYPFTCWWMFELFSDFLSITNKSAMNILVQVFMWLYAFMCLGWYLGVEFPVYMVGVYVAF